MGFKPGTLLIVLGLFLILMGLLLSVDFGKISELISRTRIGSLPGDIVYKRDGFTFYFPLATSILISVIATIILNLVVKILR